MSFVKEVVHSCYVFSLSHQPANTSASLFSTQLSNTTLFVISVRKGEDFSCQEDRAILRGECDISIHKSHEYTQKHSRFLLPGVKLSANSSLYPTSSACSNFSEVMTAKTNDARASKSSTNKRQRTVSSNEILNYSSPSLMEQKMSSSSYNKVEENFCFSDNGSGATSSISEYLMKTLPGWHVEDLLDFSYDHSNAFCEVGSSHYL